MKKKSIHMGLGRGRVLATSSLLLAATLSQSVQAAGVPEEVIVTGSRIPRDSNLEAPSPVQTVGSDTLKISGSFNIIDVLNDVPALGVSTTSELSNQSGAADGQNTLNLRGLGDERTLVLVNGRRHVSGVEGAQSVEIGSNPAGLIERVEVVTGGA